MTLTSSGVEYSRDPRLENTHVAPSPASRSVSQPAVTATQVLPGARALSSLNPRGAFRAPTFLSPLITVTWLDVIGTAVTSRAAFQHFTRTDVRTHSFTGTACDIRHSIAARLPVPVRHPTGGPSLAPAPGVLARAAGVLRGACAGRGRLLLFSPRHREPPFLCGPPHS